MRHRVGQSSCAKRRKFLKLPTVFFQRKHHQTKIAALIQRGVFIFKPMQRQALPFALPWHKQPLGPAHQHINPEPDDADQDNTHDNDVRVLEL